MAASVKQFLHQTSATSHVPFSSRLPQFSSPTIAPTRNNNNNNHHHHWFSKLSELSSTGCGHRTLAVVYKATPENENIIGAAVDDEGVSLGTMKLPLDTDIPRFESLLFQWANSLCQGANLPLPMPLKVDKIAGGARLGFITIDDGKTEVLVYIDCLIFPATGGSGPIFRAIRNGPMKDQSLPGEPRIMRSLLQALKKSVEIARV